MTTHLGLQRIMIPSAQVSSLTTGSITLPSARGAFSQPTLAFESISTTTGSGGSFTISSIPQTFTHLRVHIAIESTRSDSLDGAAIRFNGDSGSNYYGHSYYAEQFSGVSGAAIPTGGGGASSRALIPTAYLTAANQPTLSTTSITDIYNYSSTTKNKSWLGSGGMTSINNQSSWQAIGTGVWNSTTAISSLTFTMDYGGSFTRTYIHLYGVK